MWGQARAKGEARDQGVMNYHIGVAAEAAVARRYCDQGYHVVAQRWRGGAGEIDLVARRGCDLVVIEVKRGRSHAEAAARVTRRQQLRLLRAGEAYLFSVHLPQLAANQEVELRFDVATVDAVGQVEISEAAFHH